MVLIIFIDFLRVIELVASAELLISSSVIIMHATREIAIVIALNIILVELDSFMASSKTSMGLIMDFEAFHFVMDSLAFANLKIDAIACNFKLHLGYLFCNSLVYL